jgi:hypothetical protein
MKTAFYLMIAIVVLAVLTPLAHAVDTTRAWSDQINSKGRFEVLNQFNGEAVFDKETGLVWERSPSTDPLDWLTAQANCNSQPVGNRFGWRLPTAQELASLVDPTQSNPPFLPAGHPFHNVQSLYWSATSVADPALSGFAWIVGFGNTAGVGRSAKFNSLFVWCVRGGQGVDPQ